MSFKFGPDRTVGSLTIAGSDGPSNGPNLANPENTRYAISVRDSNDIQIEIRAHLRAHDNLRIPLGQKCPSTTMPTRRPRAGSAWVSKAITHRRKNHKSRLKTPTLVAGISSRNPAETQFVNRVAYATNRSIPTQQAARARKIGEKPYLTCRNRWPDDGEQSRRSFGRNRAFLFDFPAKSRQLAAGPGRGRKRTAARSFWYRPRQLWWPDESTAGQNVAGCLSRREPEERERDARERESV
ncbi:unnamed protein product [Prunus armeniaca]